MSLRFYINKKNSTLCDVAGCPLFLCHCSRIFHLKNGVIYKKEKHKTIFHSFVLIRNEGQETRRWGNEMKTCQHSYQRSVLVDTDQFKLYAEKCSNCEKIKHYPLKEMKIILQLFGR